MAAVNPAPLLDNRKAGRFQDGRWAGTGVISAIGRPWRTTTKVSPCSTAVIMSEASFLNAVKLTVRTTGTSNQYTDVQCDVHFHNPHALRSVRTC